MTVNDDNYCHYSDLPSPNAYQEKTDSEIITRIIELEIPIVHRIISDKTYRPHDKDEYQSNREELKILREKVKHAIYPQSHLPEGDTQRPPKGLDDWKKEKFGH